MTAATVSSNGESASSDVETRSSRMSGLGVLQEALEDTRPFAPCAVAMMSRLHTRPKISQRLRRRAFEQAFSARSRALREHSRTLNPCHQARSPHCVLGRRAESPPSVKNPPLLVLHAPFSRWQKSPSSRRRTGGHNDRPLLTRSCNACPLAFAAMLTDVPCPSRTRFLLANDGAATSPSTTAPTKH